MNPPRFNYPDPHLVRAFEQGRATRLAGHFPSGLPHEDSSWHDAWLLGWKSVKESAADSVSSGCSQGVSPGSGLL